MNFYKIPLELLEIIASYLYKNDISIIKNSARYFYNLNLIPGMYYYIMSYDKPPNINIITHGIQKKN